MAQNGKTLCTIPCFKTTKHRDKGWCWAVLFASFCVQMLCDGTISGFGVVYAGLLNDTFFKKMNYTEGQLALPGALQSCLYVTAMGIASALVNLVGFQWVGCIGGLLGGLSMTAAVFCKYMSGMIVLYGIFSGLGLGAVFICAAVAVTYNFERYRGVASGIAAAGNGFGYMVVPLILNGFTSYFDPAVAWRYSVFIFSLIVTVACFFGGLMLRPIEIEYPTMQEIIELEEVLKYHSGEKGRTSRFGLETIKESEALKVTPQQRPSNFASPEQDEHGMEVFASAPTIPGTHLVGQSGHPSSHLWHTILTGSSDESKNKLEGPDSTHSINKSQPDGLNHTKLKPSHLHSSSVANTAIARPMGRLDSLFLSNLDVLVALDRSISTIPVDVGTQLSLLEKQATFGVDGSAILSTLSLAGNSIGEEARQAKSLRHRIVRLLDLTLFCNYYFAVLTTSFVVLQLAYFVPFVYFFTYIMSVGVERRDSMILLTIIGIVHTIGRLMGGVVANFPKVDIAVVTAVSNILCGVSHIALPFLPRNFTALGTYAAAFGFLCAVPCPLQALLFVRFLGLARLNMSIGNSSILKGIAAAVGPILAGCIKDAIGSLDGVFYWCGGCFLVSGLLVFLVFLPGAEEWTKRETGQKSQ